MAVAIVDFLEMIEIQKKNGKRMPIAIRSLDFVFDGFQQITCVICGRHVVDKSPILSCRVCPRISEGRNSVSSHDVRSLDVRGRIVTPVIQNHNDT